MERLLKAVPQRVVNAYKREWQRQLIDKNDKKKVQSVVWKDIRGSSQLPGSGFQWLKKNITSKQVAAVL